MKWMVGSGLALDHSDTSHSRLRWTCPPLHARSTKWIGTTHHLPLQQSCRPRALVYSQTFTYLLTFTSFAVRLQGESHGTAAAHPCGCVLTCSVAATVVHRAGLCRQRHKDGKREREGGGVNIGPLLLKYCEKETIDTESDVGWDKASCSITIHNQTTVHQNMMYSCVVFFQVALSIYKWGNYITTLQFSWEETYLYRGTYDVHTHRMSQSGFAYHWQQCINMTRQKHMTLCW